jgi:serine/threonine-protein kinase
MTEPTDAKRRLSLRPRGDRKWQKNRFTPFVIAGGGGFLLAFLLVAALVFPEDDAPQEVRVPSVLGLPFTDAERRLRAIGLTSTLGERRFAADAPRSAVLAQNPVAGRRVNLGTEIVLDVSDGQEGTSIPVLNGLSRDDAERALRSAGLEVGDVIEEASTVARGVVLSARPTAGQTVPTGTKVSLVLSAGPNELTMPDVVGRDMGLARSLIEQLGLVLGPVEYDSLSTLGNGTVIAQSPAAGASLAGGSVVSIRVAGRP